MLDCRGEVYDDGVMELGELGRLWCRALYLPPRVLSLPIRWCRYRSRSLLDVDAAAVFVPVVVALEAHVVGVPRTSLPFWKWKVLAAVSVALMAAYFLLKLTLTSSLCVLSMRPLYASSLRVLSTRPLYASSLRVLATRPPSSPQQTSHRLQPQTNTLLRRSQQTLLR